MNILLLERPYFVEALDRAQGLEPALAHLETEIVRSVADALEKSLSGNQGTGTVSREIDRELARTLEGGLGSRSGGMTIAGSSSIGTRIAAQFQTKLQEVVRQMRSSAGAGRGRVRGAVRGALVEAQRSGKGRVFLDLQRRLTKYLSHLAWIEDPGRIEYLKPIIEELQRRGRR